MKLWLDDMRPAPPDWSWARTAGEAIRLVEQAISDGEPVEEISLDHDLGPGAGGTMVADYLALDVPRELIDAQVVVIHSWNQVGAQRMKRILQPKGYTVVIQPFTVSANAAG